MCKTNLQYIFQTCAFLDTPRRLVQVTVFFAHLGGTRILQATIPVRDVLLGRMVLWKEKLMTPTVSPALEQLKMGLNAVCRIWKKTCCLKDVLPFLVILNEKLASFTAPCGSGLYLNEGQCEACPRGFYKDTDDDTNCTSCVEGTTTEISGATSQYHCSKFMQENLSKKVDQFWILISNLNGIKYSETDFHYFCN